MRIAELYDEAYQHQRGVNVSDIREQVERDSRRTLAWVTENKERFLAHRSWEGLRVLECGGGQGGVSLQLARLGADCTLIDFAPTALEQARELARLQGTELKVHCLDLSQPLDTNLGQFDLVIDSHVLHCLALTPERVSFFQSLHDLLAPGGIVVGETMAHRKKMFIPTGWRFDDEYVLWQKLADWVPVRRIADSLELESEFQRAGFKIQCFFYYGNYGIAPGAEFWDIPADVLPAAVRYCLTKS